MIVFVIYILAALFSFFVIGCVLGAAFSKPFREKILTAVGWKRRRDIELVKVSCNPILSPGAHPWAAEAVMNPAAIELNGRTHLIYRAIGMDGVSRFGYASSADGFTFDERLPYPVYVSVNPRLVAARARRYSPTLYPSGGSWGGAEDPRMVAIDGRIYVTFNLIENWNMQVVYISLSVEDFLAKRFTHWDNPVVISYGLRHKNWVLFPEKFNGHFAVLHSIIADTPDRVRVEYVDNLDTLAGRYFESPDPQQVPNQEIAWHVHMRSAGPPPLRTEHGWLVFYHAHDHEGDRYKLGALLLDLNDPTKVVARAHTPVMLPDEWYENDGKPGIVYANGAVIRPSTPLGTGEQMLYVYYGGADRVVCVAFAPLEPFLQAIMHGDRPELGSQPAQTE